MEPVEYDCTLDLSKKLFRSLNRQERFYSRILSELSRERFDTVDKLLSCFTLDDLKKFKDGKGCFYLVNWGIVQCVPLSVVKYWSEKIPRDLMIETLKARDYFGIRSLVRTIEDKKSTHSLLHKNYAWQKLNFLAGFGDEEVTKFINDETLHLSLEGLSINLQD